MGMYENLNRLKATPDEDAQQEAADEQGMHTYCWEVTDAELRDHPGLPDAVRYATGLHLGILLGLSYAAEFGIPDIAKNLFTVEPA